jgi:hypothetical protein
MNTIPLQQFIQQVKSADAGKAKEVKLTIDQAKKLAFTLGEIMSRLEGDLEKLVAESKSSPTEITEVVVDGGNSF